MARMQTDFNQLVGAIYDCAVEPALWPNVLSEIRDRFSAAYAEMGIINHLPNSTLKIPNNTSRNSGWDQPWLDMIPTLLNIIPSRDRVFHSELDTPWSRLTSMREDEFKKTEFYNVWSRPQKLRDCINVRFLKGTDVSGMLTVTGSENREPFSADECEQVAVLAGHVRRSFKINQLVDKGRAELALQHKVLDSLSVAVVIVGQSRRIAYANAAAETMLFASDLLCSQGGCLGTFRGAKQTLALEAAIDRACTGDAALGTAGLGVPLLGTAGTHAAAYVLPLARNNIRGELGRGHCAVFIARASEQHPMAMEILRTMFDFTVAEARVALMLSKGDGPQEIADALGVSVHTVRSHLKHAFAKVGVANQTGLVACVNSLIPPIA